ncbi:hypothetical protein M3Y94_01046100 [Aphelenchoides besseyi]|nr:hypothetical protein M3Y94_01046100 [Aphelenchoides besseyi]KAI6224039.1 hypothetical protein M3Y95_00840800 [Aphelenchoides besseyi]
MQIRLFLKTVLVNHFCSSALFVQLLLFLADFLTKMFRFVTLSFVLVLTNSANGDPYQSSPNPENTEAMNQLIGIIILVALLLCSVGSSVSSSVGGYMYAKRREEENRQVAGNEMVSITESILFSSDCIV